MAVIKQEPTLLLYAELLHLGGSHAEALPTVRYSNDTSQCRPAQCDAQCFTDNGDSEEWDRDTRIKQHLCKLLLNVA